MKSLGRASSPLPALLFCAAGLNAQPAWRVDSAVVAFEIRNAGLPVHGTFSGLEAEVRFDPAHSGAGRIRASIDASTVRTGIGLRDRHLVKRGWLDVERHPRIRMESVRLKRAGDDEYAGTFLLELKGVRHEVVVPFTFVPHADSGVFEGTFAIDRRRFGVGGPSVVLADGVVVRLHVRVSRRTGNAHRQHRRRSG